MTKIARIGLDIVIYITIVVTILFGLPRFLSWSLETPYPMAAITSGSMWPALKEGDLVFIQGGIEKEELKKGDIIVFRNDRGNLFTIHRIVSLGEDTLVTQGDANFEPDAPIKYGNIIGRTATLFGNPVHIPLLGSVTVIASNIKENRDE